MFKLNGISIFDNIEMKVLAVLGAIVCGVAALKTDHGEHQLSNYEHELFWCCDRKGG